MLLFLVILPYFLFMLQCIKALELPGKENSFAFYLTQANSMFP